MLPIVCYYRSHLLLLWHVALALSRNCDHCSIENPQHKAKILVLSQRKSPSSVSGSMGALSAYHERPGPVFDIAFLLSEQVIEAEYVMRCRWEAGHGLGMLEALISWSRQGRHCVQGPASICMISLSWAYKLMYCSAALVTGSNAQHKPSQVCVFWSHRPQHPPLLGVPPGFSPCPLRSLRKILPFHVKVLLLGIVACEANSPCHQ